MRLTWNAGWSGNPSITADSGNWIHMVWDDDTPGEDEIFYKQSTDGGGSWTRAERLTWNTGWSSFPFIAADSSNDIHVVWHDVTPGNYEIFYKNRK